LEWTGPVNSSGYGGVSMPSPHSKIVGTHVAAWIDTFGLVPDGMLVLHSCDVRHCIEPGHLFLGTKSDNALDMLRKGRGHGRSFWDTAAEAEKQLKVAQIRETGRRPKSAETRKKMSEARKCWWKLRAR
jgi:hypothetical protein